MLPPIVRRVLRIADNFISHPWITRISNTYFLGSLLVSAGLILRGVIGSFSLSSLAFLAAGVVVLGLGVVGSVRAQPAAALPTASAPAGKPPPRLSMDATGAQPALVQAQSANDDHFPRIESAVDSFGDRAESMSGREYSLWSHSKRVLRPGQQVSFELELSDPNGEDVAVRVLTGNGDADVAISPEGVLVWNVREENIADPAYVHIYAASQRTFHRENTWDASANFIYRVLPRLAPKGQA